MLRQLLWTVSVLSTLLCRPFYYSHVADLLLPMTLDMLCLHMRTSPFLCHKVILFVSTGENYFPINLCHNIDWSVSFYACGRPSSVPAPQWRINNLKRKFIAYEYVNYFIFAAHEYILARMLFFLILRYNFHKMY